MIDATIVEVPVQHNTKGVAEMGWLIVLFVFLACLGRKVNGSGNPAIIVKTKKPRKWFKPDEEMWHPYDRQRKNWTNLGSNTTTGWAPPKRRFINNEEPADMDYYEDYFDDNCD